MFVSAYEHGVSAYYRVCLISLSLDAAGDFFPTLLWFSIKLQNALQYFLTLRSNYLTPFRQNYDKAKSLSLY